MRKYTRQRKILELIENKEIETQEELSDELENSGINITQATISRDIKELGLVKVITNKGRYKYAAIEEDKAGTKERLMQIFRSSIINFEVAGPILVIKTLPGSAQICALAIDSFDIKGVVGTIAGYDTIFTAINSEKEVDKVIERLKNLLN